MSQHSIQFLLRESIIWCKLEISSFRSCKTRQANIWNTENNQNVKWALCNKNVGNSSSAYMHFFLKILLRKLTELHFSSLCFAAKLLTYILKEQRRYLRKQTVKYQLHIIKSLFRGKLSYIICKSDNLMCIRSSNLFTDCVENAAWVLLFNSATLCLCKCSGMVFYEKLLWINSKGFIRSTVSVKNALKIQRIGLSEFAEQSATVTWRQITTVCHR